MFKPLQMVRWKGGAPFHAQLFAAARGRGKPLPRDAYFLDNALKGVTTSVSKTAGSRQNAAGSYRVVKNMNRRTAEQGTVEYRSEKYFLILF